MPRNLGRRAPVDARAVALSVLDRVVGGGAFADAALSAALARTSLPAADRALATGLVYGTLTWQGRLDHHLSALVTRSLDDLERPVLLALRLGLFQLLFLDRVPAYAAVDASVRLVAPRGRGAQGLVNAVLRRAVRLGRRRLALPDPAGDPVARLAVEWSYPRWLVERWRAEVGPDAVADLLAAGNRAAPTVVRVNRRRTSRPALRSAMTDAGIDARDGAFGSDAIVVESGAARLAGLPAYRDGGFAFQGEASQLVAALIDVPATSRVLEACAGSGGKTLAMAGNGLRPIAMDRSRRGFARLVAEADRLGLAPPPRLVADARVPPMRAAFDAILIDAPCTGFGTIRQHPELKWRRRPEDPARLGRLQREMVDALAPLVAPGGLLVYAVCTSTPEETVDVVDAVLGAHPRFDVERAAPAALTCARGFLRTWPHRHGLDGFFAARMRARA